MHYAKNFKPYVVVWNVESSTSFSGNRPAGSSHRVFIIPHCNAPRLKPRSILHIIRLYYCGKTRLFFFHLCADVRCVHSIMLLPLLCSQYVASWHSDPYGRIAHNTDIVCGDYNTCSEGPPGGNTCSDYFPPPTRTTLQTGVSVTALNVTCCPCRIFTNPHRKRDCQKNLADCRKTPKIISSNSKVTWRRFVCPL